MLNEYPKMVSVGAERVRVENADHERALTGGEPWSPPKAASAAPSAPVDREYPKILTHPDSGERITVQNRDEEFHLRRFASEFQDRSRFTVQSGDGYIPEPIRTNPAIENMTDEQKAAGMLAVGLAAKTMLEPDAPAPVSKPAPRKRGRPAKTK